MRLLNASNLVNAILVPALWLLPGTSTANCVPNATSPISGIPSCAWCCVQDFILSNYPKTSGCSLDDLECLCRANTKDGFTLGEAALCCTITYCPVKVLSKTDVYRICVDIPGALPETHPTLTATIVATISSPEPTKTTSSTTIFTTSTLSRSRTSFASSSIVTSSSSHLHSQISSTLITSTPLPQIVTPPIPSSSSKSAQSPLSTGAVIGVSVASGLSATFLIGVLLFFCSRKARKRHLKATQRDTFEIGGHMTDPILATFPPVNRSPSPYSGGAHFQTFPVAPLARGPLVVVNKSPTHSSSSKETVVEGADTPGTDQADSPTGRISQRAASQLLPEKPDYSIYPEPLRVERSLKGKMNDGAVFEGNSQLLDTPFNNSLRHVAQPMDISERNFRRLPQDNPNLRLPAGPQPGMYGLGRARNLTDHHQNFSLQVPSMPGPQRNRERRPDLQAADNSWRRPNWYPPVNRNQTYVANVETAVDRQFPPNGMRNSWRTSQRLNGRPSASNRRSSSRISGYSDTSFESLEYDEDEEDDDGYGNWSLGTAKPLSPVKEYSTPSDGRTANGVRQPGAIHSSPIRYPRMPRSASVSRDAEVIPRPKAALMYERDGDANRQGRSRVPVPPTAMFSDPYYGQVPMVLKESPSSSRDPSPASSLLARRVGDIVADKMEAEFRYSKMAAHNKRGPPKWKVIEERSDPRPGQYGSQRAAALAPRTPPNHAPGIGTPDSQRAHNLTPSRRGEDLYLSVD